MRVDVEDDTIDEIVRKWLVMHSVQLKTHEDASMRFMGYVCRLLLEINWPHMYDE